MARSYILLCFILFSVHGRAQEDITRIPLTIGETVSFESEILEEHRRLNIYLPYGYQDSAKSYPVIYLLDGSIDEDITHIAGLVQFASFSWIKMMPESIVVGIANVDRQRDFTFHSEDAECLEALPTAGGSDNFIGFIENEVIPLVQKSYRVAGPATIIGQSLGGLLATEILFEKPELFDQYIIVSPSLWWDRETLLERTPKISVSKTVYIAVGNEGPVMQRTARELYEKLKSVSPGSKLYFDFLERQDHGDALHLAVYHAFEFLSGRR